MYDGSGTVDRIIDSRQPADAAACALNRRQHFSKWNNVTAAVLKVWSQIENSTLSVNMYLI